jgi:ABC-type dipeptide/oligopeptide/nickel transport system permease component
MWRYLVRRLALSLATLAGAAVVIFATSRLTPGGPEGALRGRNVDPKKLEQLRARYGWDQPLPVQFADWIGRLARGDLGASYFTGRPTAELLAQRLPATAELTLAAMAWAVPVGVLAGVAAAVRRGGWLDRALMAAATTGLAVPVFFLGLLLLLAFPAMPIGSRLTPRLAAAADFVPVTGFVLWDTARAGDWPLFADALKHLALPALALGTIPAAIIARMTRASLLETLGQDFVRTARAKGAGPVAALMRHALRCAAVPVVTVVGLQFGALLSGAVLTETVFSWPGMGTLVRDACVNRDYEVLQSAAVLITAAYVAVNLAVDLLYPALDPRIAEA